LDSLKEIIASFSEGDRHEFRLFIQRLRRKNKRKDLQLFSLLSLPESFKPTQIIHKLYGGYKKEAYHALRKRLFNHLTEFLVVKRFKEDQSESSFIMGQISAVRYLMKLGKEETAWKILEKAELLASSREQYELLNTIYNLYIEKAAEDTSINIEEILLKKNINKQYMEEEEQANLACSIIRQKLLIVKKENQHLDFDFQVQNVLKKYRLDEAMAVRPKLLLNLVSITRSAMVTKKDYYSFEPFVIEQYRKLENKGFETKDITYQIEFLYMIAHTLYRNKKFSTSEQYLEILLKKIESDKIYFNRSYPKYILLQAAIHVFSNENRKAIILLQDTLKKFENILTHLDEMNIRLNLTIYLFQSQELDKAVKSLISIYHTDKWCEKVLGKEWVLKKNLIDIILQYEMENYDIALSRIQALERAFNKMFESPTYKRVKVFIQLIKRIIKDPHVVTGEAFHRLVESSFEWVPLEQEDIQAVSFYAWLKSKMQRKNYYSVLIELVKTESSEI
jgi:hypothetical protein